MAGRYGISLSVTLLCFQLHCHALELKPDLNTDALSLIEYLLSLGGVNVYFPQFMDHLKDALNWALFPFDSFCNCLVPTSTCFLCLTPNGPAVRQLFIRENSC